MRYLPLVPGRSSSPTSRGGFIAILRGEVVLSWWRDENQTAWTSLRDSSFARRRERQSPSGEDRCDPDLPGYLRGPTSDPLMPFGDVLGQMVVK